MNPALHKDNLNFSWSMKDGPFEYLTEKQISSFNSEGYLVMENAFDEDLVTKVIDKIDPYEFNVTEALKGLDEGKFFISRAEEITFTTHLVTQSDELKDFSKHEFFRKLCKELGGDNVRLYWDQAVYKKPGTLDEFPWHQDNGYNFVEPQAYLTCWIALTDTDEFNGCPWIMPGLHKKGTLHHEATELGYEITLDSSKAVPVPLKAGSIAVFSSLTPHRTGPNTSKGIRKAYILQYAPEGAVRKISHSITAPLDDEARQYLILKEGKEV